MKVILTTTAPDMTAQVDPRFGRGAYLLVIDTDTNKWRAHANPGMSAPGGAGIEVAQFAVNQGVGAVISGDFGPNAVQALQAGGIAMYVYGTCQTAQEAIEQCKAGQLRQIDTATRGKGDHRNHR
jgi:predicted Fe-Mo cluster-binding NifX family protein